MGQIRSAGQGTAIAANPVNRQVDRLADFYAGCLTKVHATGAHIRADFGCFRLYCIRRKANGRCGIKAKLISINIHSRINALTGIKNRGTGIQADRTPSRQLSGKLSQHGAIRCGSRIQNPQGNTSAQSRQTDIASIIERSRTVDHCYERRRQDIDGFDSTASRDIGVL